MGPEARASEVVPVECEDMTAVVDTKETKARALEVVPVECEDIAAVVDT